MRKKWILGMSLIGLLLVAIRCATSPEGRSQMILVPDQQMEQMGAQGFNELKSKMSVEQDPATNRFVHCVAEAIVRVADPEHARWEIVVFKEPTANAFALPGRKIGVHTGILSVAQTADQLAAVLGHEVGHVLAKHGAERASQALVAQGGLTALDVLLGEKQAGRDLKLMAAMGILQVGYLLPHSRTQESEADIIGLRLMAKAGFDPRDSVKLWQNMAKASGAKSGPLAKVSQYASTHPSNEERIDNLRNHLPEVQGDYARAPQHPHCER